MNIKKGDKVQLMKGKDRGKSAKVLSVIIKEGRILLDGLNLYKKNTKPKKQGEKGQLVTVPRPVRMDNVQILCASCGKPTRIGIKIGPNGGKTRYCKKCNATI